MPGRRCVLLGSLLVVLGPPLALRAADEPAAAAASPAAGTDGITAARRDFEVIKGAKSPSADAARSDPARPGSAAPSASSEEMRAFLDSRAGARQPGDKAHGNSKSENWLVDAMTRDQPASHADSKPEPLATKPPGTELSLVEGVAEQERIAANKTSAAPKPPPPRDNPLTNYMASWMTAKDFDLLQAKPADATGAPAPDRPADRTAELRGNRLAAPEATAELGRTLGGRDAPDARSNPYLNSFTPPPTAPAGPRDLPNLTGAPNLPTFQPPPANLAPPKNEFAPPPDLPRPEPHRPVDDSKYFPQLKRF